MAHRDGHYIDSQNGGGITLAGTEHIAKFGGQIQYDLVFDDILRNTTHGVTPWRLRAGLIKIRIVIKPGNRTL